MTREEALNILHNASVYHPDYLDALNMAINALEQEPCEDAVSRTDVLELIEDINDTVFGQVVSKGVMNLPSVNPQKMGKWIRHPNGIYAHLVCDKCLSRAPYDCRVHYCPNCGAKMVEPQESEVQDADSN